MAALDDPDKRAALLNAVGRCGSVQGAAQVIGLGRRSINAYLRTHPELAHEVKVERARHKKAAWVAPSVMKAANVEPPPELPGGFDAIKPVHQVDRGELIGLLLAHANDPQSRGCSKALSILSELAFMPEILRVKAAAKKLDRESADTTDSRPLVVRVPSPKQPVIDV